jgi:uncharacterized membrane protein
MSIIGSKVEIAGDVHTVRGFSCKDEKHVLLLEESNGTLWERGLGGPFPIRALPDDRPNPLGSLLSSAAVMESMEPQKEEPIQWSMTDEGMTHPIIWAPEEHVQAVALLNRSKERYGVPVKIPVENPAWLLESIILGQRRAQEAEKEVDACREKIRTLLVEKQEMVDKAAGLRTSLFHADERASELSVLRNGVGSALGMSSACSIADLIGATIRAASQAKESAKGVSSLSRSLASARDMSSRFGGALSKLRDGVCAALGLKEGHQTDEQLIEAVRRSEQRREVGSALAKADGEAWGRFRGGVCEALGDPQCALTNEEVFERIRMQRGQPSMKAYGTPDRERDDVSKRFQAVWLTLRRGVCEALNVKPGSVVSDEEIVAGVSTLRKDRDSWLQQAAELVKRPTLEQEAEYKREITDAVQEIREMRLEIDALRSDVEKERPKGGFVYGPMNDVRFHSSIIESLGWAHGGYSNTVVVQGVANLRSALDEMRKIRAENQEKIDILTQERDEARCELVEVGKLLEESARTKAFLVEQLRVAVPIADVANVIRNALVPARHNIERNMLGMATIGIDRALEFVDRLVKRAQEG